MGRVLPDQAARDAIAGDLGTTILVEAAAGTGKTTGMVGRMVALARAGADVKKIAAVTFTRKAAAELRGRFRLALERERPKAAGGAGESLSRALGDVDKCFVGTIHSFCARLLRERPVEAGLGLDFRELDEDEDRGLREEAWRAYMDRLSAGDLSEEERMLMDDGVSIADLEGVFVKYVDYPDVEEWPVPAAYKNEGMASAVKEILEYGERMRELTRPFPYYCGNDKLAPALKRAARVCETLGKDLSERRNLAPLMEHLSRDYNFVQKEWMATGAFTREQAKSEKALYESLRDKVVEPVLRGIREDRYRHAMAALERARAEYDRMRAERGLMNFQDLLMRSAGLLRGLPHVRRYFSARYERLLVDEFQDTDPVQAEVMMLLCGDDETETDWRKCRPRPGSLFVVGDPKQSIYRFRRADIVTYNHVTEIIGKNGVVLNLSANFRAGAGVIEWVNRVFEPGDDPVNEKGVVLRFPEKSTPASPSYVALTVGNPRHQGADLDGVYSITIPAECKNNFSVVAHDAARVARTIRHLVDSGATIALPESGVEKYRALGFEDFLVIARGRKNLATYAGWLDAYGIPCQVSGGTSLNEVPELRLLHLCVSAALNPDDPVALTGTLRSELFGVSDRALYRFKRAGGVFSYRSELPKLGAEDRAAFEDAFTRFRRYAALFRSLAPGAALEAVCGDLGLSALAAAGESGQMRAGGLMKAVEIVRRGSWSSPTLAGMLDHLAALVAGGEEHDAVSVRSESPPAARVMNLHKAKGLEAPVVFLVDPTGESRHDVEIHVDRDLSRTRGYMAVVKKSENSYGKARLAEPSGWDGFERREEAFQRAEELRLRYVAATRAGAALIVSQREKGNHGNPWQYFRPFLERELADPGEVRVDAPPPVEIPVDEPGRAERRAGERLSSLEAPSYLLASVKELAAAESSGRPGKSGPGKEPEDPSGEAGAPADTASGAGGPEWGSVIHALLQAAASGDSGLEPIARALLDQYELDPTRAEEAVDLARKVMRSELWKRARRAERMLTEVPLQVRVEKNGLSGVARGVVDLAFLEQGGWVLVDYKTDRVGRKLPPRLLDMYGAQLNLYGEMWEKATGLPVKERLLYFVVPDLLRPLPAFRD